MQASHTASHPLRVALLNLCSATLQPPVICPVAWLSGEWQDDMKHGQGTSVYPSGNSYSGFWVHDRREGSGTMTWASKGQRYSGMWADNVPNGLGEHVWQQGMPGLQIANHTTQVMHNR
jgi:hypothetical protein